MKRSLKWAIAALALVLVAGGAARLISGRKAQQAAALAAVPVETVVTLSPADVVRAAPQELVQTLPLSGSLRALDSAVLKARAAGELTGLTVREGDAVTAGQIIARIDPSEYQSRARQAQEQADSARAQADVTQRAYDNNKALVDQGFISKTALDTSLSNLNAALATHRAALAAAEVARKSLNDTVLRSPLAGLVAQRFVQPGERVAIDARVIEVVDLRRIELEATLAAADSVAVRVGQRATLEVEGSGPALAGQAAEARLVGASVVRVNPSAQAGSRSVLIYLRLDQHDGLRQGLFAQGTIEVGRSRALALPLSSVRVDKPAPYVQVVQMSGSDASSGRIAHRNVQTGQRGLSSLNAGQPMVQISGVDDGALVIVGSVGQLREGTAVRLTATAPQ